MKINLLKRLLKNTTASLIAVFLCSNAHSATIFKLYNNTNLNVGSSWQGGVVPGSVNTVVWTNGVGTTTAIGGSANYLGVRLTGSTGNSVINSGQLTLGAGGIDLSQATNRTFSLATTNLLVTLGTNQTWRSGVSSTTNFITQIVITSVMNGTGGLTVDGSGIAARSLVQLNSASTYSGGFTLNNGGVVRISTGSTASGGVVTSGALGTGDVIINGGTIFGSVDTSAPNYFINNDFSVNVYNNANNGRVGFGGNINLMGDTRTVTLGRSTNVLGNLTSGFQGMRLNSITGGPTTVITNGTLRFVADAGTTASSDYTSVGIQSTISFADNAEMIIGNKVMTAIFNGTPFNTNTLLMPKITVENSGLFNLSDSANARSANIFSLAGNGTVLALLTNAVPQTATLTINGGSSLSSSTFSGAIKDTDNSLLANGNGIISVTKRGSNTQIFSGTNTYTGQTLVQGGTLMVDSGGNLLNSTTIVSSGKFIVNGIARDISVSAAGTLGGSGTVGSVTLNGGLLSAGNSAGLLTTANIDARNGSFLFELDAPTIRGVTYDAIDVSNLLTLGSNTAFNFQVNNNYSFQAGDTYDLFNWNALDAATFNTDTLANALPTLNDSSLSWDVSQFTTDGSISVYAIPEPSSGLSFTVGILTLGIVNILKRRKNKNL
jgi:autotransporter-associated beta strand protein